MPLPMRPDGMSNAQNKKAATPPKKGSFFSPKPKPPAKPKSPMPAGASEFDPFPAIAGTSVPSPYYTPPVGANESINHPVIAGTDQRPAAASSAPTLPQGPWDHQPPIPGGPGVPPAGGAPPAAPGGAGGTAPTAPTQAAVPAFDWAGKAKTVISPYLKDLQPGDQYGGDWAHAGRVINNQLAHTSKEQADPARSAFIQYLRANGLDRAAYQLGHEGDINTTVHSTPVNTNERVVIPSALTDPGYITEVAQGQQVLDAAQGAKTKTYGDALRQYTHNVDNLGYNEKSKTWNSDDMVKDYGAAYHNLLEDFASRGATGGSAYNQALSNLIRTFQGRQTDMYQGLQDTRSAANASFTNAQGVFNTAKQAALMRAAQKIMGEKGVAIGDVPTTSRNSRTITRPIGGH